MSETVKVIFVVGDSEEIVVDAPIGLSILEVAHKNKDRKSVV